MGFGESRIGSLIREHQERKPEVEDMQKEMSYYMLATFADGFRGNPMKAEIDRLEANGTLEVSERPALYHGADLSQLEPEVTQGIVRFSRRHSLLLDQILQFPLGIHDDGPDALEMAMRLARQSQPSKGKEEIYICVFD